MKFGYALRRTYHWCIEMPTAGVEPANRESTTEDPVNNTYVLARAIVEPASISGGAAKCMQKFLSHGLPIRPDSVSINLSCVCNWTDMT